MQRKYTCKIQGKSLLLPSPRHRQVCDLQERPYHASPHLGLSRCSTSADFGSRTRSAVHGLGLGWAEASSGSGGFSWLW